MVHTTAIKTFYRYNECYYRACDKKSFLDELEMLNMLTVAKEESYYLVSISIIFINLLYPAFSFTPFASFWCNRFYKLKLNALTIIKVFVAFTRLHRHQTSFFM